MNERLDDFISVTDRSSLFLYILFVLHGVNVGANIGLTEYIL